MRSSPFAVHRCKAHNHRNFSPSPRCARQNQCDGRRARAKPNPPNFPSLGWGRGSSSERKSGSGSRTSGVEVGASSGGSSDGSGRHCYSPGQSAGRGLFPLAGRASLRLFENGSVEELAFPLRVPASWVQRELPGILSVEFLRLISAPGFQAP